jgi:hypothetical protein
MFEISRGESLESNKKQIGTKLLFNFQTRSDRLPVLTFVNFKYVCVYCVLGGYNILILHMLFV